TGASLATPSVPRKSRSPSADTLPDLSGISSAVATAFTVTPAQATSASNSISPEQSSSPEPPVAGCSPAVASARPVSTLQAMLLSSSVPLAFSVMNAALGSLLYRSLIGACIARNSPASMLFSCTFALLHFDGPGTYRLDAAKHKSGYHHMAAPVAGRSSAACSGTRSPVSER